MALKAQRVGRTLRSHRPPPAARAEAKSAPTRIDVPAYQGFWPNQPDLAARPGVARASPGGVIEPIAEKFSLVTACRACRDAVRVRVQRHARHFRYSSHLGPTYAPKSCRTACVPGVRRSGLSRGFATQGVNWPGQRGPCRTRRAPRRPWWALRPTGRPRWPTWRLAGPGRDQDGSHQGQCRVLSSSVDRVTQIILKANGFRSVTRSTARA
jgi:hypothetical protein